MSDFSGKDLFDLVDNGNEEAKAALSGLYDALATGIFNCLVSFTPDLVGIGGGISVREDRVCHPKTALFLSRYGHEYLPKFNDKIHQILGGE